MYVTTEVYVTIVAKRNLKRNQLDHYGNKQDTRKNLVATYADSKAYILVN
jgi:hypothetical protein